MKRADEQPTPNPQADASMALGAKRTPADERGTIDASPEVSARFARIFVAPGSDVPDWFPRAIGEAIATVRFVASPDRNTPGRKELRRRLDAVSDAAKKLSDCLADRYVQVALADGAPDFWKRSPMRWQLVELIQAVEMTITAIAPVGKGQRRPGIDYGIVPPRTLCAQFAVVIWETCHGAPPKHTARAAESLRSPLD